MKGRKVYKVQNSHSYNETSAFDEIFQSCKINSLKLDNTSAWTAQFYETESFMIISLTSLQMIKKFGYFSGTRRLLTS
jgi:hypothetical protein